MTTAEPNYVIPQRARPPQLSAADIETLTPGEVNRARTMGQLQDLLNPPKAQVEALPKDQWNRLTAHDRGQMIRTYGPSIDPTTDQH